MKISTPRKYCGIVGYVGNKKATPILIDGLKHLEYRGYDSAGIAVRDGDNTANICKVKGKVKELEKLVNENFTLVGNCGIGHTRWATHGEPSDNNAHPHCSDDMEVVGVHNGIIENYQELKQKLIGKGYTFYSETDTEVFVKLIDYYYKKYGKDPINALSKTLVRVLGSYSIAVMFNDFPDKIYTAKKDSPMVIGKSDEGVFVASDVSALISHTRNIYHVNDYEMAELTESEVVFYNLNGDKVGKTPKEIDWDITAAEKCGYEHFMLKEIFEQPKAVRDTLNSIYTGDRIDLKKVGIDNSLLFFTRNIYIVACGSAYNVGCVLKYAFERLADITPSVEYASEFRYRKYSIKDNSLIIIISQSGETADSLAALRSVNTKEYRKRNIHTLAIVNVMGSSIAREAEYVIYTKAGPEISVATTKAYSCQLAVGYALAIEKGKCFPIGYRLDVFLSIMQELKSLPDKIEKALGLKEQIQALATKFDGKKDAYFIGRGIDYAVAQEASLKLKEVSYIHSEAYAAGELKHGPISLIEDGTPVICINTQKETKSKTASNVEEVKCRGGSVIQITTGKANNENDIVLDEVDDLFSASVSIIPLQLLAYYTSVQRGIDVDKPRNLAKSVTVE